MKDLIDLKIGDNVAIGFYDRSLKRTKYDLRNITDITKTLIKCDDEKRYNRKTGHRMDDKQYCLELLTLEITKDYKFFTHEKHKRNLKIICNKPTNH